MELHFDTLKELLIYNIKYYRYEKGISQEHLAEKSGLSPRYITDIERGKHCPTINKLELIARALDIAPYILFQNNKRKKQIIDKMTNSRQYNQNL